MFFEKTWRENTYTFTIYCETMSQLKDTSASYHVKCVPKPYSREQNEAWQDLMCILGPYEFANIVEINGYIPYNVTRSSEEVEYILSGNVLPLAEDIIAKLDEWNSTARLQLDKERQIVVLRRDEVEPRERECMDRLGVSYKVACVTELYKNERILIGTDGRVKFNPSHKFPPRFRKFLKRAEKYGIYHLQQE